MDLKKLTTQLIQKEFEGWLISMQFSEPFEGEDIDVDVLLKEEPADLLDRSYRIHRRLRTEGFDVLIGYDIPDGSDKE